MSVSVKAVADCDNHCVIHVNIGINVALLIHHFPEGTKEMLIICLNISTLFSKNPSLQECYTFRIFQNIVLRIIFVAKSGEVTEDCIIIKEFFY